MGLINVDRYFCGFSAIKVCKTELKFAYNGNQPKFYLYRESKTSNNGYIQGIALCVRIMKLCLASITLV